MQLLDANIDLGLAQKRRFTVELFDGSDLAAADWPSITAGPDLLMYVFQSREFLDAWMTTIGRARGAQCFLIVVKNGDNEPVLYLPLAIETKFNARILRFMDAGVADFNAPILAAGRNITRSEFSSIWDEILARLPKIDLIDLKKIASEVSTASNPLTFLDCRPYESSGYAIDLAHRDDAPCNAGSIARMRRKLFRQGQRLSELGPTQFVVNPPQPQRQRIIERLMELKREQYLRTSGQNFLAIPGVREFYSKMIEPKQLGLISHLSALTCGADVVSAHLGFVGRGRFYYVLPAFDIRHRSLATGFLLLDHLIERCVEERYSTFDLGEGDFSYKTKWATHRLPLLRFERAVTPKGALLGGLRRARNLTGIEQLYDLCANRTGFAAIRA